MRTCEPKIENLICDIYLLLDKIDHDEKNAINLKKEIREVNLAINETKQLITKFELFDKKMSKCKDELNDILYNLEFHNYIKNINITYSNINIKGSFDLLINNELINTNIKFINYNSFNIRNKYFNYDTNLDNFNKNLRVYYLKTKHLLK